MKEGYNIRKMSLDDSEDIIDLLQESLRDSGSFFLPVKPTKKSAYYFYKMEVEPAIINGDPCYVIERELRLVAFSCSSTCINQVYDLERKTALGVLTFVKKEHRRQGISEYLRYATMKGLKDLGVEYVICDINKQNLPSFFGMQKICNESGLKPALLFERYGCGL